MSIKFGNDYSRRYCVGYLDLFDQMSDLEKEKKLIYAEKNMTEIAAATAVSNGCWSEWSIAKIEESPTEESQRFIEIEKFYFLWTGRSNKNNYRNNDRSLACRFG